MKLEIQTCTRCGWGFIPTRVKRDDMGKILEILMPRTCPNCNSPYWNKQRTKGVGIESSVTINKGE